LKFNNDLENLFFSQLFQDFLINYRYLPNANNKNKKIFDYLLLYLFLLCNQTSFILKQKLQATHFIFFN